MALISKIVFLLSFIFTLKQIEGCNFTSTHPVDCSTRAYLITPDANNHTALTTAIFNAVYNNQTSNFSIWTTGRRLDFNSYWNSIRAAIWNNGSFPTLQSKLNEIVRIIFGYSTNTCEWNAANFYSIELMRGTCQWGNLGDFYACGNATANYTLPTTTQSPECLTSAASNPTGETESSATASSVTVTESKSTVTESASVATSSTASSESSPQSSTSPSETSTGTASTITAISETSASTSSNSEPTSQASTEISSFSTEPSTFVSATTESTETSETISSSVFIPSEAPSIVPNVSESEPTSTGSESTSTVSNESEATSSNTEYETSTTGSASSGPITAGNESTTLVNITEFTASQTSGQNETETSSIFNTETVGETTITTSA